MEPHIATRKLRLATLLENDLFVRLPRGVTAARTKLAVQRWQSVHVWSTLQTFITWPPSPGRATCLVQERSVFSVIVAGTTEQFLFFLLLCVGGQGWEEIVVQLYFYCACFVWNRLPCLLFGICPMWSWFVQSVFLFDILRAVGEGGYLSMCFLCL